MIRAIGKSKAMELVLTGDRISAQDAEKAGKSNTGLPKNEPGSHADLFKTACLLTVV